MIYMFAPSALFKNSNSLHLSPCHRAVWHNICQFFPAQCWGWDSIKEDTEDGKTKLVKLWMFKQISVCHKSSALSGPWFYQHFLSFQHLAVKTRHVVFSYKALLKQLSQHLTQPLLGAEFSVLQALGGPVAPRAFRVHPLQTVLGFSGRCGLWAPILVVAVLFQMSSYCYLRRMPTFSDFWPKKSSPDARDRPQPESHRRGGRGGNAAGCFRASLGSVLSTVQPGHPVEQHVFLKVGAKWAHFWNEHVWKKCEI